MGVDAQKLAAGSEASGFTEMPMRAGHGLIAVALPPYHCDPFDRMLVAQFFEFGFASRTLSRGGAFLIFYPETQGVIHNISKLFG